MAEIKTVEIELGGITRKLRYDFNAMAKVEEKTGRNMLKADAWSNLSATEFRTYIWAGLLHFNPDITEEEVGAMLSVDVIMEIAEAMNPTKPEGEDQEPDPLEPDSPTSGLSEGTTSD